MRASRFVLCPLASPDSFVFIASHGIYGAPRVFLDLREAGPLSPLP
jgi:hypothetical protein